MRKTILTLCASVFAFASINAFAQTEAGHGFVGAKSGIGFSSAKTSTKVGGKSTSDPSVNAFNLNLNGGYFVIDNLAIGGLVDLGVGFTGDDSAVAYKVAPKVTYFAPVDSQFRPYANLYVGYAGLKTTTKNQTDNKTVSERNGALAVGGGIGVAYFLQSNIALSLELGYDSQISNKKVAEETVTTTAGTFAPALGFTLFF